VREKRAAPGGSVQACRPVRKKKIEERSMKYPCDSLRTIGVDKGITWVCSGAERLRGERGKVGGLGLQTINQTGGRTGHAGL